ncbi:hypothetical protein Q2T40_17405 [Winogradskyella maritima]|uniref:2TM domain-containing protein n=1 Tax=Winogradskyella maritima TaxID=1517766 RepID=A0ABV8AIJ4_9FLAO|nr:hypothetical protein [Winogradskyella maritima]
MKATSWKTIKERAKKRKIWIAFGNTLFIAGFLSFSNHPDWGIWCSAVGFVITAVSLVK